MAVTLTHNYRETFAPETVEKIDSLRAELYDFPAMVQFIDEHGEDSFMDYYEDYVKLGEDSGYAAVEYFVNELASIDDLNQFDRAYIGWFREPRDFAEDWFECETSRLDYRIVIDWEETARYLTDDGDIQTVSDGEGEHYFRKYY